jgi:hypothetical protein
MSKSTSPEAFDAFFFQNSLEAAIQTDKNTILSALLRKGQKIEVALNPTTLLPKQ